MLVKSSLKNSYLSWGLHLNPHFSEKAKKIYTGYGKRKKSQAPGMKLEGGRMGEDFENYSVSHFYLKDQLETLNFLSYVGVMQ